MTLRELVTLARGPIVGADLREAEVARLPADRSGGQLAEAIRVPLDSSYLFERDSLGGYVGPVGLAFPAAGSARKLELQPYDQVTIFRQPQFELQRAVQVTGEVAYPGTYALRRRDERMSDLVGRAGGLLPTAYPDGARFYRHEETSRPETGTPVDTLVSVHIELAQVLGQPGSPNDGGDDEPGTSSRDGPPTRRAECGWFGSIQARPRIGDSGAGHHRRVRPVWQPVLRCRRGASSGGHRCNPLT